MKRTKRWHNKFAGAEAVMRLCILGCFIWPTEYQIRIKNAAKTVAITVNSIYLLIAYACTEFLCHCECLFYFFLHFSLTTVTWKLDEIKMNIITFCEHRFPWLAKITLPVTIEWVGLYRPLDLYEYEHFWKLTNITEF